MNQPKIVAAAVLFVFVVSSHAGWFRVMGQVASAPKTPAEAKERAKEACEKYAREAEIAASAGIANPRPLRTKACAMWKKRQGSAQ